MRRPVAGILLVLVAATSRAGAGPAEARERWREAVAMKRDAPWRDRLLAYRAVRREASPTDPIGPRAFAAEAKILRDADHAHGAAASEAAAASIGPRHDEDRIRHALSAARVLLDDGDRVGARHLLDDVVENGGAATASSTGPAILLLARLAADSQDGAALSRLDRRAAEVVPSSPGVRLETLDLLGLHRLGADDLAGAKRALAEQRRVFDVARRAGGAPEREAAKTWLDLDLPKQLEGR